MLATISTMCPAIQLRQTVLSGDASVAHGPPTSASMSAFATPSTTSCSMYRTLCWLASQNPRFRPGTARGPATAR
jgi:hypothetical protein